MNIKIKYTFSLILLAFCTSISSCSSGDISDNTTLEPAPNSTVTPEAKNSPLASQPLSNQPSPSEKPTTTDSKAISGKTTQVTLYTSDDQCQDFVSKKVAVAADESMNAAIGKILETRDTADFSLAGYRATVNNGVATIDIRVAPDSKRQIASLSNCEQFALFGSLRKTLTSNAEWKIKDVRFTQGGEEIVF
jgi:hypothetical protein